MHGKAARLGCTSPPVLTNELPAYTRGEIEMSRPRLDLAITFHPPRCTAAWTIDHPTIWAPVSWEFSLRGIIQGKIGGSCWLIANATHTFWPQLRVRRTKTGGTCRLFWRGKKKSKQMLWKFVTLKCYISIIYLAEDRGNWRMVQHLYECSVAFTSTVHIHTEWELGYAALIHTD